jgi:hypothetical protein
MNAKPNRAPERRDRSAPRPGGRAAARRGDDPTYATQGSAALSPQVGSGAPRPDEAAAKQPWLKVAPPMPVSVPRAPFVLLLLMVVVGGVLGILMVNTEINQNAFTLKQQAEEQAALNRQEQDLKQQIAEYESPNSLWAAARKLGLVPAESPAFIRMPDGRVIGVPQPATGAPSITSAGSAAGGQRTGPQAGGE